MSVAGIVRSAAERFGPCTALEDADRSVTFGDLFTRLERLASGLTRSGVAPGQVVLTLVPNSVSAIEIDLGLTVGGHVRVALNPRLGPAEWSRVADDCTPQAIVLDPTVEGALPFAEALAQRSPDVRVVVTTPVEGTLHRCLEEVISTQDDPLPLPELADGSLCGLHYSSGTTGRPKGAKRSHANRLASCAAMRDHVLAGTFDGADPAVFLHAGPVIHTSGLFVLPVLEAGGRQVLLDHPDSARIVEAVARHTVTHTVLVPTAIAKLLELTDDQLAPLRRLRMLAYAGAPMPSEHIRRAHARLTPRLVQYYGMVEAMPPLTVLTAEDHQRGLTDAPELLHSAGRVCPGVTIDISSPQGPLADGEIGELVVRGPAVSPGYHNAESRTDLGKSLDGTSLRTGDLGWRDAKGYVFLTGRDKDMLITGGYNVYPREVEEALRTVEGVTDAVVVGLPDDMWGDRIVAGYTTVDGADGPDERTVLAAIRELLPDVKRPKSVHHLPTLPTTALGKVDRVSATRVLQQRSENPAAHPLPSHRP